MPGVAVLDFPDLEEPEGLNVSVEIWFGSKEEFLTDLNQRSIDLKDDPVELVFWLDFPDENTDTGPVDHSDVLRAFEVFLALFRYDGHQPFEGFKGAMEWLLGEIYQADKSSSAIAKNV
jgi:hypothetical protein